MAKIFWIAEKSGDYMQIFGFNKIGKAQEKAMELAPHFSYGDNEVPKEQDNYEGEDWLYSGQINAGVCFILGRADGMPDVQGFKSIADAKAYAEKGATGACFPVKLKGGMGSVYMSSETEGDGRELFAFEDGELDREVKTGPAKDGKKEPIAINSLEGRLKILAPAKYKFKYPIQLYVNHTKMDYPHRDRSEFKDDIVVADPNKSMKWFLKSYSKKGVYPEFYKADARIDVRGGYGLVPSMIVVSGTKDGLAYMLYMEYYGGHAYQSGKGGESIDGAWPKIMNDWPVLKGADINKFREDWMGESKTILESFKYVPTFESFLLNEAKVEIGNLDPRNTEDKWKLDQINDILKGAIGKKMTLFDLVELQQYAASRGSKELSDKQLKGIEVEITNVQVGGFYAELAHEVSYKYDPEHSDVIARLLNKPEMGYTTGSFLLHYGMPNSKKWVQALQKFADVFNLGDITPNFPDEKGNVADYDNIDYYGKLSVNCYQFVRGSMSKMVSFLEEDDIRLYKQNHTKGAGYVLCHKKDLKKIHEDLLDGFEGKKPRLNNIPMIGLDAKAEENGSVTDSAIYQKKWDGVCKFLGARNTSDLVCVNILMYLGYGKPAKESFSEEEIKHAKEAYNGGFFGKVPQGIAPLVKRIRVKKYMDGRLV